MQAFETTNIDACKYNVLPVIVNEVGHAGYIIYNNIILEFSPSREILRALTNRCMMPLLFWESKSLLSSVHVLKNKSHHLNVTLSLKSRTIF